MDRLIADSAPCAGLWPKQGRFHAAALSRSDMAAGSSQNSTIEPDLSGPGAGVALKPFGQDHRPAAALDEVGLGIDYP